MEFIERDYRGRLKMEVKDGVYIEIRDEVCREIKDGVYRKRD